MYKKVSQVSIEFALDDYFLENDEHRKIFTDIIGVYDKINILGISSNIVDISIVGTMGKIETKISLNVLVDQYGYMEYELLDIDDRPTIQMWSKKEEVKNG